MYESVNVMRRKGGTMHYRSKTHIRLNVLTQFPFSNLKNECKSIRLAVYPQQVATFITVSAPHEEILSSAIL